MGIFSEVTSVSSENIEVVFKISALSFGYEGVFGWWFFVFFLVYHLFSFQLL